MAALGAFWAGAADLERLFAAERVTYLVGSYDGSGSFGDILQLASSVRRLAELRNVLPVAFVSAAKLADHRELCASHPDLFPGVCFVFYTGLGGRSPSTRMLRREQLRPLPTPPAVHDQILVYGGGFFNSWWGSGREKLALLDAIARWRRGAALDPEPLVAVTGQQISGNFFAGARAGDFLRLLGAARIIGARDSDTLRLLQTRTDPATAAKAFLSGDDAVPLILRQTARLASSGGDDGAFRLNVHLSLENYVTRDSKRLLERVERLVRSVGQLCGYKLCLRLLCAYEDRRISEKQVLEQLRGQLGIPPERVTLVHCLADLCDGALTLGSADLTIACSYHVGLTSLLCSVPTVLLYENGYFAQKHQNLAEAFGLPPELAFSVETGDEAGLLRAVEEVVRKPEYRLALRATISKGAAAMTSATGVTTNRLHTLLSGHAEQTLERRYSETVAMLRESMVQLSDLRLQHAQLLNASRKLASQAETPRPAGGSYAQLVQHIRESVQHSIPPRSTVCVVSRGDDELLKLGSRRGWHFPRSPEGAYAGYHPSGSAEAIARLEDAREHGAEYLLLPATASWWLEHYREFSEHLERHCPIVHKDDGCTLYALGTGAVVAALRLQLEEGERRVARIRKDVAVWEAREGLNRAVESSIPPDSAVLVIGDQEQLQMNGRPVRHLSQSSEVSKTRAAARRVSFAAIGELESHRAAGARFLVAVNGGVAWLSSHPEFQQYLELQYGRVADESGAFQIFALDRTLELRARAATLESELEATRREILRRDLVQQCRDAVRKALPSDAVVLVVSRGDEDLLDLGACVAWHFPQDDTGRYAGHHPADSAEAIRHVEALRARGAGYLLFPPSALWWLDYYAQLREYLEARSERRTESGCAIFSLRSEPLSRRSGGAAGSERSRDGDRPVLSQAAVIG